MLLSQLMELIVILSAQVPQKFKSLIAAEPQFIVCLRDHLFFSEEYTIKLQISEILRNLMLSNPDLYDTLLIENILDPAFSMLDNFTAEVLSPFANSFAVIFETVQLILKPPPP